MCLTSRLFFAAIAIVAGIAVAVGTVATARATFTARRTAVAHMSFPSSGEMSLQSDLSVVLENRHLCSSTGSRPGAGPRFSSSSPSFFCGYQSRACFYIL